MKSPIDYLRAAKEILLYAYIWQIPFSWRIIFDPSRSAWNTSFNEYMDISLYVGEVFIVFALLTHILEYILIKKSILEYLSDASKQLFHVKHKIAFFVIGTLILSVNVLLSIDPVLSLVSLWHWSVLIIFVYLSLVVYVSRGTSFIQSVFFISIFSLLIQLVLSLFQVINSGSVGVAFLNESKLSLDMENVAKSHLFSDVYLRAYGTFLHPNILAAYALLIAVFSKWIVQLGMFHVERVLRMFVLIISFSTILLTQSKITILLITLLFLNFLNDKYKLFHVKQVFILGIFITTSYLLSLVLLNSDAEQSLQTRIEQINVQSEVTVKELIIGSGIGTYRLSYDKPTSEWWNYEPVHFVPVLIFKELGIFLTAGAVVYVFLFITRVPRETLRHVLPVLVFILCVGFIDHFPWDVYQGMAVVSISILILYIDKYNNKLYNNSLNKQPSN